MKITITTHLVVVNSIIYWEYIDWWDIREEHIDIYETSQCCEWRFVVTPCILTWESDGGPEKGSLMHPARRFNKFVLIILVLSSRTDFSVIMLGQISSWRRHLSTKQWSGNKSGDVPTKIQTSIYAMDHRDWPGKQRLAEHQACRCTHLQHFSQAVKPSWRLILSIFCF